MQILEFEGVPSSHEVIALTPGEEIRIIIKLYPEDPENIPDGLDVYLLTPGESGVAGFDGFSELYQFPGIVMTQTAERIVLVFTPQEGEFLGIYVNSGYTDESSSWRFTVQLGGFDTAPLIFTPATPDALQFDDPEDPASFTGYGRVHIRHEDSPYGISVSSLLVMHEGLRLLALPVGMIEHYDSTTGALRPLMTITSSDGTDWSPDLSFDNAYLQGNFETAQPLMLFGQEVLENDFALDARGPVFGFFAWTPEELGDILFGSTVTNAADPVLTIDGDLIGEARWQIEKEENVDFFYGSFHADILHGELTIDADTSEWSLTGNFLIRSLIDNADPIKVVTAPGSLGFFNNPNEGGTDGELFSHDGTTIHTRPPLGGAEFNLGIADVSLKLENYQDFAARVGNVKIPLDLSGRYFVNPNFLQTTSSTYTGAGTHKLDGFSVMADNVEDPDPVEYATPLAGAILDDFSLGVAGLWADDDTPTTVAAYFKFDWRGGLSGQPLAEARLTTQLTSAGLEGAVLIGMGEANSLFQGAGHGILSPYTSGFYARVGGTFHLPYVGDIVVAQLELTQRFGMFGKLTGKADTHVILPAELMSLFALTGPLDTDLEVSIGSTEHRSGVELSAHIHSGGYDGEFGIRVRFNGTYEFLGGIVLEADAPADALGGAPVTSDEAHAFDLTEATELLLMRALGDLDAASVVVIAPDGTEYSGADLAARGITLIQDSGGITARVTNAEAGSWQMVAPGATDWIGFADTPDVALTVERVVTAQGETLRVIVTGPDQDYDLSILAAGEDGDALVQLEFTAIQPGVHDFAVARLGLGPGDWTLGASVSGEGQVTAEAMLATPVAIAGAADIAVTVDIAPATEGEEGLGLVLIRIENQGDAPAYDIEITGAEGAITASLAAMLPGQSVVITADLASLGFDPDAPFAVTVAATHSSYEAAAADDLATATYAPGEAAAAILWTVEEDSSFFSSLAETVAVVTAPSHGTLIPDDHVWLYTPSPDYSGADIAVVTLNGVPTRLWFDVRASNDAPTASDKTLSTGRDLAASLSQVQILAGAIDLDQDSLSVTAFGAASHGTVTTGPDGAAVYTPYYGYTGVDSFSYTVSDGQGGEVTATVHVTVTGVTPRTIYAARLHSARIFDVSGDGALHSVTGTAFNDTLIGGAGNETLNGGGGGDLMTGAFGNDSYYIDDVADQVIEQADQGTDAVRSTLNSYALGDHVEKLLFAGTGDFVGTGNGLDNSLTGGTGDDSLTGLGGNDTLNGAEGDDVMAGGEGSDSYYVGAPGDQVVEQAGQGTDTVRATVSYGLGDHLEKLLFAGSGDFSGSGNGLNNTITGGAGEDTLSGLGGNDRLFGGGGGDVLVGGAGSDHLTGEAGGDTFRFDYLGVSSERDSVRDFVAGEDRIEISRSAFTAFAGDAAGALTADAFFLGMRAQTADQHLIYNAANSILYYDADGAGGLAQIQIAVFANHAGVTAGDIFLI